MSDANDDFLEELFELARNCAIAAGSLLRTYGAQRLSTDLRASAVTKSSPTDLATAADEASEELIVEMILADRPDDAVLAEEKSSRQGSSGITWVIDPLDGTTNFVYGFAPYAISIAAKNADETLVGVVYDPAKDELLAARVGRGATCNGIAIEARRSVPPLSQALIGTGFSYDPNERAAQAQLLQTVLPNVRDVRRAGAAAVDLCSVAMGRLDAYYESGLKAWDSAAGLLICTETGLRHGELALHEFGPTLLVGPPRLFEALIELLESAKSA